jgi:hypothetical protein
MRPFPLIRIAGRFTPRSTRFTLVVVKASRGVQVRHSCRRANCSRKLVRLASRTQRLRALERVYKPGAVIEIRVSRAGTIGKLTTIRIRRGAAPVRSDRCLSPSGRSMRCPS